MSFSDMLGSITVYYLICIGHTISKFIKWQINKDGVPGLSELLMRCWYLLVCVCVQHSGPGVEIQETACSAVWWSSLSVYQNKYTQT